MEPLRDAAGNPYSNPNNKQAESGTQVTAHTSTGDKPATMVGGYVVVNRKS
jgi:hypothetical protein